MANLPSDPAQTPEEKNDLGEHNCSAAVPQISPIEEIGVASEWCVSRIHEGRPQWWTGSEWSDRLADVHAYATKAESDAVRDTLRHG